MGSVAAGTRVLSVGGSDVLFSQLPYTNWFDSGTTYSYYSTVAGSVSGTQFALTGTSPVSPVSGTSGATVTGTYKTQYQHTITNSPSTGSGYIIVDSVAQSTPYTTPWWDSGSTHTCLLYTSDAADE